MSNKYCSEDTVAKVAAFEQADLIYKDAFAVFEAEASEKLEYLDGLREDRNVRLDEAKRSLREDAIEADITKVKTFKIGGFTAQKKWSSLYQVDKLIAGLKDKGLYTSAIEAGIVKETVDIAKFDAVQGWLKTEGVDKAFEDCEDGRENTPAILGPKPIAAFGAESKDK